MNISTRGGLNGESEELTFTVSGMDCGSCAAKIETALSRLPGVADVKVSVARERLNLSVAEQKTSVEKIEDTLRKLGFTPALLPREKAARTNAGAGDHDHSSCGGHHGEAAANAGTTGADTADTLTFSVSGMDCGSCAAKIETALSRLPGVADVKVSVARERLNLSLTENKTPVEKIEDTLRKLGFTPALLPQGKTTQEKTAEHDHGSCSGHDHDDHDHSGHDHADHPRDAAPAARQAAEVGHAHDVDEKGVWWRSAKARNTFTGAILVAAAYAAELAFPAWGGYAFIVATLVTLLPIAKSAINAARFGAIFTIEMLMTIAAIGAIFIGEAEEAAIVVLLFSIGELLEGFAAARARSGIKALGSLLPKTALVEENGTLRQVPADQVRIGQVVVARPGDRISADGVVMEGESSVDESPMTGESIPVAKEKGARVFAGSINHDGSLRIRVDRAPEDNTIARIITLVEEAQDARAPTERFIQNFSRYYMPLIVIISVLTIIVPPLAGLGDWDTWIYRGLALLLIGCPCALVISVPAAIASSLSAAARHGMLVKGGAVIEMLARTETVAFDKTGTLTLGEPVVTDVVALDGNEANLIAEAATIEHESSHPLARAIVNHAEKRGVKPLPGANIKAISGRGMQGNVAGKDLFIGAPRFATEVGTLSKDLADRISALESEGKTVAVVMAGGAASGLFAMRDEPRKDAADGVKALKEMGISSLMLSGDNARTAKAIGNALGLEARGELLPQNKVEEIRKLAEKKTVVMVGDGINDAPALAAASVGVAIGSGTDVAMEAADAALMRNNVGDAARLIGLSRATMLNIRQNVAISLGLKAVFLVTTVTGLSGLWLAVFADTGATVLVTANAMRLLGYFNRSKA
ncbi:MULTISPECIES: heavy metal translocating P-type ATPase [unclassified Agrobacterium]|uniref:heavy metal translocating P-type ATPase n=1 Tax=unclassified Agrobacterium TaxID=2632611 RepID=UPI00244D1CD9|nr:MULTISPECIES: heavy metal translocating P-type ATPase [unclassified Agrobacterium]MDH0616767.1 heavy metal translocating P-type ATPase [Agrobacterium sp. GD03872]MDH0698095.1 heavy metal translocating P-type ATPase [Agrobacterium sp. GD03871]MDH1062600.1 heavy metal translocating P-type ATPase [Agrobacterium sp. GD03992]MDH2211788.1 heavy metal translocating P-type ATPase [Agrobacterium sp. GD03643]MDH2222465.1 heavy metal translocating P-type ATPase [Agrobacterium sp. GD03638]